ncbi:hypothetical protein CGZ94_19985 [Enemella evansiae]|uniref:DinB-like domain-containing protein n=1 Tax=Enemella evansiae TaxID=2016499 RepID=A0A255FYP9_9ACTN|nr:DinB family protein [Enemella evansiae]OYO08785.1 hypothetical protein CGZ94_19985 [Enemella evansiae]
MYACSECGFGHRLDEAADVPARLRADTAALADLVRAAGVAVTTRPAAETWSPLEYACHVRDVLLTKREQVIEALLAGDEDDPPEARTMHRDERVLLEGYAESDPVTVDRQLRDAAELLASVLERVPPTAWDARLRYGWPTEAVRDLRWLAVHTWHEVRHHMRDVAAQLER